MFWQSLVMTSLVLKCHLISLEVSFGDAHSANALSWYLIKNYVSLYLTCLLVVILFLNFLNI